jgi:hypothetical protein
MASGMAVIHKQVVKLTTAMFLERQTFEVPIDAEMVEIDWDTREFDGIAFWYKIEMPENLDELSERPVKQWSFYIRGTGHAFPEEATHLATVVRDGFAWHLLDADGSNISWADL